jgi:serine/threonine protein kinase
VWALGVCLYCFVTGRLPFLADNVMEMYDKIKSDECVLHCHPPTLAHGLGSSLIPEYLSFVVKAFVRRH